MKMIQNTLMACLFLMVAACSQTDNVDTLDENQTENSVKASEQEDPIFIQEIMLISIERELSVYQENPDEYAEQIEKYSYYRDYLTEEMDQFSGLPGKGCPKPLPCNCQSVRHSNDHTVFAYGELEFQLHILSLEGEVTNEIVGSEQMKCPKPTTIGFEFDHPLEGSGRFVVEAFFEPAGELMKFEALFEPAE